jgi:hypothetical protein
LKRYLDLDEDELDLEFELINNDLLLNNIDNEDKIR